ncbi:hypothetical protein [Streptomyces goshikiensis]|uniref:hypothetical protein n=1 Tax=Streptomyces goshikiensis TaxID=1942 RepID=UPI003807A83F
MSDDFPALPAGPTQALAPPAEMLALDPAPAPPEADPPPAQVPEFFPEPPPPADVADDAVPQPESAPTGAEKPAAVPAVAEGPVPTAIGQEIDTAKGEEPGKDMGKAAEEMGITLQAFLELLTYLRLVAQLAKAGHALRGVGARVRETYEYVADCAKSVDHQVALAAHLRVDPDTLAEHRQAAQMMRGALAAARRMASSAEAMAVLFVQAEAAHRTDYGPIAERAASMPGGIEMADRNFYRSP